MYILLAVDIQTVRASDARLSGNYSWSSCPWTPTFNAQFLFRLQMDFVHDPPSVPRTTSQETIVSYGLGRRSPLPAVQSQKQHSLNGPIGLYRFPRLSTDRMCKVSADMRAQEVKSLMKLSLAQQASDKSRELDRSA